MKMVISVEIRRLDFLSKFCDFILLNTGVIGTKPIIRVCVLGGLQCYVYRATLTNNRIEVNSQVGRLYTALR